MNEQETYETATAEGLFEWLSRINGIEGITLSGGEPFEQPADALLDFCRMVKSDRRDLSIIVFTGFLLEELKSKEHYAEILDFIDLLIDGPYMDELNDGKGLRGSSNQRLHFLSGRYEEMKNELMGKTHRRLEMLLGQDGRLEINGIPQKGFMKRFEDAMWKQKMSLE